MGNKVEPQTFLMAKVCILIQACIYPERPLILTQLLALVICLFSHSQSFWSCHSFAWYSRPCIFHLPSLVDYLPTRGSLRLVHGGLLVRPSPMLGFPQVWALHNAWSFLLIPKGPTAVLLSATSSDHCSLQCWFFSPWDQLVLVSAAYVEPKRLMSFGIALESTCLDVNSWSTVY